MIHNLPQLIVNGLIAASITLLISLGLTMIFGVLGFINFAHAELAMVGAYLFFLIYGVAKIPLVVGLLLAALGVGLLNLIIERFTFRPVRKSTPLVPLIISVGVSFALSSIVQLIFGANAKTVHAETLSRQYSVFGAIITETQLAIIAITIVLVVGLFLFLKYTALGKAMRAVADNAEVAEIVGIDVNRTIAWLFFIGGALAGIAGALVSFERNMYPSMGLPLNIAAFAAVIVGGVGSVPGAVIGSLLNNFAETIIIGINLPVSWCALFSGSPPVTCAVSAGYKSAIAFVIVVLMLLIRPRGILGRSAEEETRS